MTTESKLNIWVEPSKYIKYDPEHLSDTILYFCWQKLKHLNLEDLPEMYIGIGTEESEEMSHCGVFDVLDDNLYCYLPKNSNLINIDIRTV